MKFIFKGRNFHKKIIYILKKWSKHTHTHTLVPYKDASIEMNMRWRINSNQHTHTLTLIAFLQTLNPWSFTLAAWLWSEISAITMRILYLTLLQIFHACFSILPPFKCWHETWQKKMKKTRIIGNVLCSSHFYYRLLASVDLIET